MCGLLWVSCLQLAVRFCLLSVDVCSGGQGCSEDWCGVCVTCPVRFGASGRGDWHSPTFILGMIFNCIMNLCG